MNEQMDFAAFAQAVMETVRQDLFTSIPARVESYDRDTQTASVVPVVRTPEYDSDTESTDWIQPVVLSDLPVAFPAGGGFSITWDLVPGDEVTLLVCDRSIAEWATTGGRDTTPQDVRRHDPNDAIVLPGIRPPSSPLSHVAAGAMVFGGGDFRFGTASTSTFVALAAKVEARLVALETTFNTHTHIVPIPLVPVTPGPSAPPLPQAIPTPPGSTASLTTKSE